MHRFENPKVEQAFADFPASHQAHLTKLRELVLDTADELDLPGGVEETLKWGEPSYLPVKPKIGSAVRVSGFDDQNVALYFNCQTLLVEHFRAAFGDRLNYSKNRAVVFNIAEPLPEDAIKHCARAALCYHLDKKRKRVT